VPDELSVGELGRTVDAMRREFRDGMASINSRLDRLVSAEVYALQSAHTDQRITALSQELQKEVSAREAVEAAFEQYQLSERDRRERERQARLYQAIVPVLMGLLAAAISIWAVVAK
jgi:Sec-independent protein translocase protein TatA